MESPSERSRYPTSCPENRLRGWESPGHGSREKPRHGGTTHNPRDDGRVIRWTFARTPQTATPASLRPVRRHEEQLDRAAARRDTRGQGRPSARTRASVLGSQPCIPGSERRDSPAAIRLPRSRPGVPSDQAGPRHAAGRPAHADRPARRGRSRPGPAAARVVRSALQPGGPTEPVPVLPAGFPPAPGRNSFSSGCPPGHAMMDKVESPAWSRPGCLGPDVFGESSNPWCASATNLAMARLVVARNAQRSRWL